VAVPVAAAPSAAAVSDTALAAAVPAAPAVGRTFTGKAAAAAPAGDVQTLLLGAVGGAALTLIGVLVGYRLGRRKG
jgi:hypothetical protein